MVGLTECSNVQKQLKHDNEGIKNHKDDYDNMEPVVVESMLHTTTPPVREGGREGGRREGERERERERERESLLPIDFLVCIHYVIKPTVWCYY